tara:strand:- start:4655 stop:5110 length:456 start_codon:yes stop_codon:yes gene_type:complete
MSLKEDMANAKIMLTDLNRRAKNEGVSSCTYILQKGEIIKGGRFYMNTMDFMTFYTTFLWGMGPSEQIVMVLGLYPMDEIDPLIKKELIQEVVRVRSDLGAVYLSVSDVRWPSFFATSTNDGWGKFDWAKIKYLSILSFINWQTDPFEVKS